MFKIVILCAVFGVIVPAFLFGRAIAVIRGIVIGTALWTTLFVLWVVGDMLKWFEPSLGLVLLVCLIAFSLDVVILAVMASLAVSKPDKISIARVAGEAYIDLSPGAQDAIKRVAAEVARRMAAKQKKPGIFADILTEVGKGLS